MAKFKKGESGNPEGRPQGTKNKVSQEIRERINDFLDDNFDTIQDDLEQLDARSRVKFYIELLSFGLPKLKSIDMTPGPDAISHEDLDTIIKMLADDEK